MSPLQQSFGSHGRQNPRELGDLRHVALPEECALVRIKPTSKEVERDPPAVGPQSFRIINRRQGMIIGNEIKRFALRLQRNGRPHHPEIIPDMKNAGRLNPGENTHCKFPILPSLVRRFSQSLRLCALSMSAGSSAVVSSNIREKMNGMV